MPSLALYQFRGSMASSPLRLSFVDLCMTRWIAIVLTCATEDFLEDHPNGNFPMLELLDKLLANGICYGSGVSRRSSPFRTIYLSDDDIPTTLNEMSVWTWAIDSTTVSLIERLAAKRSSIFPSACGCRGLDVRKTHHSILRSRHQGAKHLHEWMIHYPPGVEDCAVAACAHWFIRCENANFLQWPVRSTLCLTSSLTPLSGRSRSSGSRAETESVPSDTIDHVVWSAIMYRWDGGRRSVD